MTSGDNVPADLARAKDTGRNLSLLLLRSAVGSMGRVSVLLDALLSNLRLTKPFAIARARIKFGFVCGRQKDHSSKCVVPARKTA